MIQGGQWLTEWRAGMSIHEIAARDSVPAETVKKAIMKTIRENRLYEEALKAVAREAK